MTNEELLRIIEKAAKEKVKYLQLSPQRPTALPPEIGELRHLTELSISGSQLTALPPEIGQLRNLTHLYISYNWYSLTVLPPEIGQLQNLTVLDLSCTRLTALPPEIGQLCNLTLLNLQNSGLAALPPEIGQMRCLTELYINCNALTALPPEIGQLCNLTLLNLGGNKLRTLPSEIGQLHNLTQLDLSNYLNPPLSKYQRRLDRTRITYSGNQLTELPPEIGQLTNLTNLYLSNNQLTELPPEIGQLHNLTLLDLHNNQLRELPPEIGQLTNLKKLHIDEKKYFSEGLSLGNNPLTSPPPEIVEQGIEAVLAYLREQLQAKQTQWVSKLLIVGEGGVGKTSLLRALRGEPFNSQESTTHGIAIRTLELAHPTQAGITMQLNAWDFGGQQIYHATHQFFLSNRSLFLLAWNARVEFEQSKLNYWLDTIKAVAPNSPILLVATHIDERTPELPESDLRQQYPQIKGYSAISSRTGAGIDTLQQLIADTAAQLPLMGEIWPLTWLNAAKAIRQHSREYITQGQLNYIMTAHKVDPDSQLVLAQWLHELGDILALLNIVC